MFVPTDDGLMTVFVSFEVLMYGVFNKMFIPGIKCTYFMTVWYKITIKQSSQRLYFCKPMSSLHIPYLESVKHPG